MGVVCSANASSALHNDRRHHRPTRITPPKPYFTERPRAQREKEIEGDTQFTRPATLSYTHQSFPTRQILLKRQTIRLTSARSSQPRVFARARSQRRQPAETERAVSQSAAHHRECRLLARRAGRRPVDGGRSAAARLASFKVCSQLLTETRFVNIVSCAGATRLE